MYVTFVTVLIQFLKQVVFIHLVGRLHNQLVITYQML